MKLSYDYEMIAEEDCFDPILVADTELFVDPFAVFDETEGVFSNAFDKIITFFNEAFKLAAQTPDRLGVRYTKLESMIPSNVKSQYLIRCKQRKGDVQFDHIHRN